MSQINQVSDQKVREWTSRVILDRLITYAKEGNQLYVISGEGEGRGHREEYTGKLTVQAMRARIKREVCGGDRWCRIDTAEGYVLAGVI